MGSTSDFENTVLKISSTPIISEYLKKGIFTEMPQLPSRCSLVECRDEEVFGVYYSKDIQTKLQTNSEAVEWKMMEISKNLFKQLVRNVNFKMRVIYHYNLEAGPSKWGYLESRNAETGVVIIRKRPQKSCNIL